mgnify:FL=1
MAIQESKFNSVKSAANASVSRAKARQAQVNANAQVLKAKRLMNQAKAK